MDKHELMHILEDWNFWKQELSTGITRETYLSILTASLGSEQVKVILGPRRSGKSYIMRQLAGKLMKDGVNKKNILIVNFEDPRFVTLDTKLLSQIFDVYREFLYPSGPIYIFLDEVQEVAGWEKWVRTMQELKKAHIIISGSNAKLLSRELATLLTGRHTDTTVLPLSFQEFLKFHSVEIHDDLKIKSLLREFLQFGAFPLVVLEKEKENILLSYFDDVLSKDIVKRYRIRKSEKLKSLIKFYLSNIASSTTFNSSGKFLQLSTDAVERFSQYLEASYLVFFLKRFSFKMKEQEKSPRKVYAIDTGLANTIGFRFSDNIGRLAENIIFLELKRRAFHDPHMEIYYWKSLSQEEVDFVIKKKNAVKELIQVCWNIQDIHTKKRELKSLLKAMRDFKLNSGCVITEDFEGEEKYADGTIRFIPLRKWLLDSEGTYRG